MSNIIIELDSESKDILRELTSAITELAVRFCPQIPAAPTNQPAKPQTEAPTAAPTPEKKPDLPVEDPVHLEPPKQEEPPFEVDKPADPEPEQNPVELSEFQKAITTKLAAHPELKAQLKALVNEYAKNVSGVPAEKRSEVLRRWAEM